METCTKRQKIELDIKCDVSTSFVEDFIYNTKNRQSHILVKAICSAQLNEKCKYQVISRYSGIMDSCQTHV